MAAPWDGYTSFGSVELTRDGAVLRQHGLEGELWSTSLSRT
jgi:hypothetical protein